VLRRAYTLIEILIVVSILGIAAAMVIPAMGDTGVLRVQAAVRTIVADINLAQSEAVAHQQPRAIIFFPEENRYVVVEVRGGVADPEQFIISNQAFGAASMGDARIEDVDLAGGTVLIFDEMGAPQLSTNGGVPQNGTIEVRGSGQVFKINIEGYTGRVGVARLDDEDTGGT
jgi:prepilin-type N-terminal cleavage/methylation domain-containing protein